MATLKVGAGGYISGADVENDGTNSTIRLIRTDTYGAYILDPVSSKWTQLVTATSMPTASVTVDNGYGVYEIRAAPSNTNTIYMEYNGQIFVSTNRGATFTLTNFTQCTANSANDGNRGFGAKIGVDPHNPLIVFAGCAGGGMFRTADGGVTWASVSGIANSAVQGFVIAYDAGSTVTGGVTQTLYISSYGTGVYASTNGGTSFTLTASTPTTHSHMIVGTNHTLFLADGTTSTVHEYASSAWSSVSVGNVVWAIAQDPASANNIVAVMASGDQMYSANGGTSFTAPTYNLSMSSADIPWLAAIYATSTPSTIYIFLGDAVFDLPSGGNKLFETGGVGVWTANPTSTETQVALTSQSVAVEQLVARYTASPPGGPVVLGADDRPYFYVADPTLYPSKFGPAVTQAIVPGYSIDYSSGTPSYLVGISNAVSPAQVEQSGYSMDGGFTWTPFASYPPFLANNRVGGCIAVDSAKNTLWVPSNNGLPYTSQNQGASWTQLLLAGVPTTGGTGYGFADYLLRQVCASDKVATTTTYIYNDGTGTGNTGGGVWKSTDGSTYTKVHSGALDSLDTFNFAMKTSPVQAGVLLASSGQQTCTPVATCHPYNESFWSSTNSGATWTAVANVAEVRQFAMGAPKPGNAWATVYIEGWVSNVYGLWYSTDNMVTWTKIATYVNNTLDGQNSMGADSSLYGHVYLGNGGSGFIKVDLPNAAVAPIVNSPVPTASGTGAVVTWNTQLPGSSRIDYGTTTAYGSNVTNASLVLSHTSTLAGLANYTLYHYKLTSTDANANTFASYDLQFQSANTVAPSAPSSVVATNLNDYSNSLTWTNNQSPDPQAISVTTVYRSVNGGAYTLLATLGAVTSYTDLAAAPSTSYAYKVSSADATGNVSAQSTASNTVTTAAGSVILVTAQPANYHGAYTTSIGTFTGQVFGAAATGRRVCAAIFVNATAAVASVTEAGNTMALEASDGGATPAETFWCASDATNTSGTIVATLSGVGSLSDMTLMVFTTTDAVQGTNPAGIAPGYNPDPHVQSPTIATSGAALTCAGFIAGSRTVTFTGGGYNNLATQQFDATNNIGMQCGWSYVSGAQTLNVTGINYAYAAVATDVIHP